MSERHAVVVRKPIVMEGHVVGETLEVEYADGPPRFGLCNAVACPEQATDETLSGLHLCRRHYGLFYFADEMFPLDPAREFPTPSSETH